MIAISNGLVTGLRLENDAIEQELPGGMWATLINVGPYDTVGPAYETLTKAIAERGSAISGPAHEFYLDGPETPPDKIRTQIAFPIS